jgi:dTDP-4-amino-4,6-dideoxygalactose transaminase
MITAGSRTTSESTALVERPGRRPENGTANGVTRTLKAAPETPGVPFASCWISPEARAGANRVLDSGWVTTGFEVAAFENEFALATGARHAVAVSSCTAAIELSLRALRLPSGSRVLVPTVTFCGAVQAVLHAGLQPVLVDVDPLTGMADATTPRRAVSAYGPPAAMVALHWAGDPVDVEALAAAAVLPASHVVVDAAHALGTWWRDEPVGSGAAVCFSFYATKNLPIGEGGMVTTDDAERAEWLRRARLHGLSSDAWRRYLPGGSWRYDVAETGLKANMTDLQAAIGRAQLLHLEDWQQRREQIAAWYDDGLRDLPGIALPHRPDGDTGRHAWHLYAVRILPDFGPNRDEVIESLSQLRIGTSVHFVPVHLLSHFSRTCLAPSDGLPGAERHFEQVLSLPMHPHLDHEQVRRVCHALTAMSDRHTRSHR